MNIILEHKGTLRTFTNYVIISTTIMSWIASTSEIAYHTKTYLYDSNNANTILGQYVLSKTGMQVCSLKGVWYRIFSQFLNKYNNQGGSKMGNSGFSGGLVSLHCPACACGTHDWRAQQRRSRYTRRGMMVSLLKFIKPTYVNSNDYKYNFES